MSRKMVVIDPGHGGSTDIGKSSAYGSQAASLAEKNVTLTLARRIQDKFGADAILTRQDDANLTLADRINVASRYGADAFVSLHAGSDRAAGRSGAEVWIHQQHHDGSERLAHSIARELGTVTGYGGIYEGPLALLSPHYTGRVNCCLVEADSMSDPAGLARLQDPAHLDRLSDAVYRGIMTYLSTTYGNGFSRDWSGESEETRVGHVMNLLINTYHYSENAAAGIVGNLLAESEVIPNRVQGSRTATPMRSRGFDGTEHDWTPEQIMNRNRSTGVGPSLAGIGLAQWTSGNRRQGLFAHSWEGVVLGGDILYSIDAQVSYLVHELQTAYRSVNTVLTRGGVSLNDASDEVVYRFEVPRSVLDDNMHLRPRNDGQVVHIFEERRRLSRRALQIWQRTRH